MTSQKHSSAVTLVLPPSSITSVPAVASPEKIESFLQSVPDILWADTVLSLSSRPGPAVGGRAEHPLSLQGGAAVSAAGAGSPFRAVLPKVPGECTPSPGAGGRASGPAAMPA